MRTSYALGLVVFVFVATLLARLPARVLLPLLPPGISCQQPTGTVWHGGCAQLQLHEPKLAL
ncbi:MAG TPA: hypothetical protein VKT19_03730, partial [Steroidobacteraceae bacterium]|nr:hypothetical protein [Steroidobacteraceae bacterium]